MSKRGGYQIVNLGNKNLKSNVGMVYDGIYDIIEGTNKPILLTGITVNDTEYHDGFCFPSVVESSFILTLMISPSYALRFTVTDTDVVTVTTVAIGNTEA